jgi:hypothetical protein
VCQETDDGFPGYGVKGFYAAIVAAGDNESVERICSNAVDEAFMLLNRQYRFALNNM